MYVLELNNSGFGFIKFKNNLDLFLLWFCLRIIIFKIFNMVFFSCMDLEYSY